MTTNSKFYTPKQVAEEVGISKDTLLRWLKEKKIAEPARDYRGWRIFTKKEIAQIKKFRNTITPSPEKAQTKIRFK